MSLRAGAAVPRERASESWRRRGRGAGGPGGAARVPKGPATKGPPTRGPVRRSALGQATSRRVQSGEKQARGRGGRRQRQARRLVSRVDSTRPRGPDTRSNAALGASAVSLGEISVRWVHSVKHTARPTVGGPRPLSRRPREEGEPPAGRPRSWGVGVPCFGFPPELPPRLSWVPTSLR